MIDVIITDLGQVLLPFDVEPVWAAIAASCPECAHVLGVFHRIYSEADLGRGRTEPEEFHRRLVDAMGMRLSFDDFSRAWSDMFREDEATIGLIADAPVRERHMLSNTNAIHWKWILKRHGAMLRKFDRLWVSHELGLEKPDPAIFRRVIDATRRRPEEHLYIDDLAENVEAARALGMAGIVHTDAEALAREFVRLGLNRE